MAITSSWTVHHSSSHTVIIWQYIIIYYALNAMKAHKACQVPIMIPATGCRAYYHTWALTKELELKVQLMGHQFQEQYNMSCSFWQWKIDAELKNNKEINEKMDRVKKYVNLIGEGCGACNNMSVDSFSYENTTLILISSEIRFYGCERKWGIKRKRTKVTHIYDYLCMPVQF